MKVFAALLLALASLVAACAPLPPRTPATAADFGEAFVALEHRLYHQGSVPGESIHGGAESSSGDITASGRLVSADSAQMVVAHIQRTYRFAGAAAQDNALWTPAAFNADMAALAEQFNQTSPDFGSFDATHTLFHAAQQHIHAHYHDIGLGAGFDAELIATHAQLHRTEAGGRGALEKWFHASFCTRANAGNTDFDELHHGWHHLLGIPETAARMQADCP